MILYSQLYDARVIPTMLYGAEVFGYINPSNFDKNTKKSIEISYGGPHLYSNPSPDGDMGWTDIYIYTYIYIYIYIRITMPDKILEQCYNYR